jgi:hypothetical protein
MIIYYAVAAHCKAGMVGIINPTSPTILDTYATAAKAVKMSVAPLIMAGGVYTKGTAGGPVGGPPPGAMGGGK